jgi:hypothetical protein
MGIFLSKKNFGGKIENHNWYFMVTNQELRELSNETDNKTSDNLFLAMLASQYSMKMSLSSVKALVLILFAEL